MFTRSRYGSVKVDGLRKGIFFVGREVGQGILEFFLPKKSWPSHFLEWINA